MVPIPCHSPKPESPKHILLEATKRNGPDAKNQTFLDITDLFKRPPGNPILSSKPRLGRCQNSRPLKQTEKSPCGLLATADTNDRGKEEALA